MSKAANRIRERWPGLAAILILWGAVATVTLESLRMNQGHLIYALDDSYILVAMARNFARHGVWGMTPFGFTASSSAPLWTFLVAALYWVFGVHTATPLILNLVFATLLVLAINWILLSLDPELPRFYVLLVLLSVLFFSPVLNLIFIGLEHTLHTLLTLLLVFCAANILADEAPPARKARLTLIALAVGVGAVRYEGLFAVAVVAALLLFRRRAGLAVELAACSLVAPFLMGAISVGHGWFWLPNSVVLKGNLPMGEASPVAAFLARAVENTLYSGMRVVRLEGVALLLMLWRYAHGRKSGVRSPKSGIESPEFTFKTRHSASVQMYMMGVFVVTATLHLMLAGTGWFLRYEAYLMALGLTVVAVPIWDFLSSLWAPGRVQLRNAAGLAATAVLLFSGNLFWQAGYNAVWMILPALHDTYRWHYQMGTFVQRYYSGTSLVVNDIGAVDFLADIHLTDPHGLADRDIARARLRRQGHLTPEVLEEVARSRGARVALVDYNWVEFYDGNFRPVIPGNWLLAGVWKFHNRVVLAPPALSFYALDAAAQKQLIENLRKYSPNLPPDVEQSGPYTQDR